MAARTDTKTTRAGQRPALRLLLGMLAGLVVTWGTTATVQALGHARHPMPAGIDPNSPDALQRAMAAMPVEAFAFVIASWSLGALAGSAAASWISLRHWRNAPWIGMGLLVLLSVAGVLWLLPHPAWVVAAGLALPLPMAWIGAVLIRRACSAS